MAVIVTVTLGALEVTEILLGWGRTRIWPITRGILLLGLLVQLGRWFWRYAWQDPEDENEETPAALDALEKAMPPSSQRERCLCGEWLDKNDGKWCACPICKKPFEPGLACKSGDYQD